MIYILLLYSSWLFSESQSDPQRGRFVSRIDVDVDGPGTAVGFGVGVGVGLGVDVTRRGKSICYMNGYARKKAVKRET
jgi:hypothetical protein